jgi:hypothetical protein
VSTPGSEQELGAFVAGTRRRLEELSGELGAVNSAHALQNARAQLATLLGEIDEQLGSTGPAVAAVPTTGQVADLDVLADLIAKRLHGAGAVANGVQRRRRSKRSGTPVRRRSLWSSLLHVDVILSAVALLIAIVVLIAWVG